MPIEEPSLNISNGSLKFTLSSLAIVGIVYTTSQYVTDKEFRLKQLEQQVSLMQIKQNELNQSISSLSHRLSIHDVLNGKDSTP